MKPFTISILASVLAFAAAVPLEKRILVVETVTDVVVKTIDVTTTLWPKSSPPEADHPPAIQQPAAPAPIPAQPPTPPAAPVIQVANKEALSVPQPPAPVNKAPSPPVPAPVPIPQPAAPAPAPAPAPVTPPKSNANANPNSGSTASCGKVGMPCSGDITFYDTGLGACGWTNDGLSENVFALAHGMMGAQSNGNPFCGRSAEVTLNGKTVVGKLVDKCGGCEGQSIDLGHKMFQALADEAKGRISDVKWRFID
ncbi:MAG: hypothetical protein Q9186_000383 [Xanthomendoza sp. 1 TL-2023]